MLLDRAPHAETVTLPDDERVSVKLPLTPGTDSVVTEVVVTGAGIVAE